VSKATIAAAGALIALAAALPSRAGLFDDDEARRRIDMLRKELAQQGNDNEARIAKLEDADLASAITGMTQADAAYRASLSATSRITQLSLMDYLK